MEEDFEPPKAQKISSLSKKSHAVSSDPVQILDAKTLLIPKLTYNGAGKGKLINVSSKRINIFL